MGQINVFKEARAIAQACYDKTRRDLLRARIDEAKEAFDLFTLHPTREAMADMVARWSRMLLAIDAVSPIGTDPTPQGRMPAPTRVDEAA